jgi:CheY-like chemotaxis protein
MKRSSPILIVDDDDDTVEALTELLVGAGFAVRQASDGLAALDDLRANRRPAMILLDWSMPRMNGRQLMQVLQADPKWRTIPVVLVTADPNAKNRAVEIQAVGYLKKPFADFDLLTMVDNTLRSPF